MMDTITFTVRDEDITNGEPGDVESCAIALALQRETGLPCEVWPSSALIHDQDTGKWVEYEIPGSARWIDAFDLGETLPSQRTFTGRRRDD